MAERKQGKTTRRRNKTHGLAHDFMLLQERNKDGSITTQKQRRDMLRLIANQLAELGYKKMRARDLKGRHVQKLVNRWLDDGLNTGTIKNRLAAVRWWAEKVGKQHVLSRDNAYYGIGPREWGITSRAKDATDEQLARITGPHAPWLRLSLRLQREFGCRREESLKFVVSYAVPGGAETIDALDMIRLKASWTKGGRARTIPVQTDAQRQLLWECFELAGNASLIPESFKYREWLNQYTGRIGEAGFSKMHGLRHQYAQRRYVEIAGFDCPHAGGPEQLSAEQRKADAEARKQISVELGHERATITASYVGRVPKPTRKKAASKVKSRKPKRSVG